MQEQSYKYIALKNFKTFFQKNFKNSLLFIMIFEAISNKTLKTNKKRYKIRFFILNIFCLSSLSLIL